MVKVVVSDGIGLIELSRLEKYLLGRPYIAFEMGRIVAVYQEKSPVRRTLGQRKTKNLLYLFKTGEYLRGVKRILCVGGSHSTTVRILLLNPAFDEIYIQTRKPEQLLKILDENGTIRLKNPSETL